MPGQSTDTPAPTVIDASTPVVNTSGPSVAEPPAPPSINPPGDIPPVPFTASPVVSSGSPSKKSGTGKVVATILGLILLLVGVGAGIFLVGQKQIFNQKASGITCDSSSSTAPACRGKADGSVVDSNWTGSCQSGFDKSACSNGVELVCKNTTGTLCAANCKCKAAPSGGGGGGSGTPFDPASCTADQCIPDHLIGDGYCGGSGNQYWCQKITGEMGKPVTCFSPSCTDSTSCLNTCETNGYTNYYNGNCFNLGACDAGERCSLSPDSRCTNTSTNPPGTNPPPTSSPTLPPSLPPGTASCTNIKAYDADWVEIPESNLPNLATDTAINFCVTGSATEGSFDMAQFTINNTQYTETTTQRPGSSDFCQNYTIQATDTTVNVTAQIHHTTLGWK